MVSLPDLWANFIGRSLASLTTLLQVSGQLIEKNMANMFLQYILTTNVCTQHRPCRRPFTGHKNSLVQRPVVQTEPPQLLPVQGRVGNWQPKDGQTGHQLNYTDTFHKQEISFKLQPEIKRREKKPRKSNGDKYTEEIFSWIWTQTSRSIVQMAPATGLLERTGHCSGDRG